MILVTITALLAVCSADKLDRTYLPPPSAQSAGGSPGSLQTPFASTSFNQGLGGIPHGSFSNEYDGVVVEAASAGTRSSESAVSGLGAPRINYGSFNSKVGEAAFKGAPQQQPFALSPGALSVNNQQNLGQGSFQNSNTRQEFSQSNGFQGSSSAPQQPERAQASADRAANTVKFESAVDTDKFNYAFETDNGITAEENGVDSNGIQAQGGFSYTGDDGQVYSVTYTADEGGYKPQGSHLPTPPPIPEEILKSLEKNAQDEAAGIIDDGSYDARKYNAGSEYTESENDNGKYNGGPNVFGNRRESAVTASGSFNQNTFTKPGPNSLPSSSSSFNYGSGISSEINPISNERPSSENQAQSGQSGQSQTNLIGATNENTSFNNKPSTSFKPQVPAYNNAAQFISQNGQENMKDFNSIQASGSLSADQSNDKLVLGNFKGFNSQQNLGNRPPGFVNSQSAFNTQSNNYAANTKKSQSPSQFNLNNEYLPPISLQQSSAIKPQGSFSSQNVQSSLTLASPAGQPNRQTLQQNSFYQNSASVQGSSTLSQNVNNKFNYQQPTLQPDTRLTTPYDDSSSFTSNSRQPSLSAQYSRPVNPSPMPLNSQISHSMTPNTPDTDKQTLEFPKRFSSSASASASFDSKGAVPMPQQSNPSNEKYVSPSYQVTQNQQAYRRPAATVENSPNSVSQYHTTGSIQSSIIQNAQYQDYNEAYYYNQPGQPFKTPSQPSLPTNQLNKQSASSQSIQGNGFFNQGPPTTVTYPSPQTAAPTVPTSATQNNLGLNQVPQFSGITQATASSFVSNMPAQLSNNASPTQQGFSSQSGRFPAQPSRPSFEQDPTFAVPAIPKLNKQPISQNIYERPAVTSQQFTGEIYQYNKPPQVFSAPTTNTGGEKNSQFQTAPAKAKAPIAGPVKPQFGSNPVFTQQSKGEIYDYKKPPQVFPTSAEPNKPDLNASSKIEAPMSAGQSQTAPQPQFGQVSYQPPKPTNTNQQISKDSGSDGSSIRPICCKRLPEKLASNQPAGPFGSPVISSAPIQAGSGTFGFQGTQSSNNNLAGRGEVFSESRKPPSYDPETGYHY